MRLLVSPALLSLVLTWASAARGEPVASAASPPAAAPTVTTLNLGSTAVMGVDQRFHLSPIVAFGWTTESGESGANLTYTVGAAAELRLRRDHAIVASFRSELYRRTYVLDRLDGSGRAPARATVDEQKLAGELFYAYELFHHFAPSRRVSGELLIGGAFRGWRNDVSPTALIGAAAGARFGVALSALADISATVYYSYNAWDPDPTLPSVAGEPRGLLHYAGYLGLRFPPFARLRVGYDGETVPLGRTYRHDHALTFLADFGF